MEKTRLDDLSESFLSALLERSAGERLSFKLSGDPHPAVISMTSEGGWGVEFTIAPGMDVVLIRGADDTPPMSVNITIMSYEGLK